MLFARQTRVSVHAQMRFCKSNKETGAGHTFSERARLCARDARLELQTRGWQHRCDVRLTRPGTRLNQLESGSPTRAGATRAQEARFEAAAMDITQILTNAQSPDAAIRQHAETTIEQAKQSNLVRGCCSLRRARAQRLRFTERRHARARLPLGVHARAACSRCSW